MTISARSIGREPLIALARGANAAFFIVTGTYCLLAYSPFAYQQFIRPHMVAALSSFVVWHHLWFWLLLAVTAATLMPELRILRGWGRLVGWTYLAASTIVGLVLSIWPVLPQVENDVRGLTLAFVALAWPLTLAVYDHLATTRAFTAVPSNAGRLVRASVLTPLIVWASQVAAMPWRFDQTGDIPLTRFDIGFGIATSAVGHLAAFAVVFFVLIAAIRLASLGKRSLRGGTAASPGVVEYWLIVAVSAVACTVIIDRLVFGSISFSGAAAWAVAAMLGWTLALVWSSTARRLQTMPDALGTWLGPINPGGSWPRAMLATLGVIALGYYAVAAASTFDWDFVLQKSATLVVWLLVFGSIYSASRDGDRTSTALLAGVLTVALVAHVIHVRVQPDIAPRATDEPQFVTEFVLDGYVGLDPSYRLIRDFTWTEPPGSTEFYRFLGENTLLDRKDIRPIDIDFVKPLEAAATPRPHIFLFVVDSLRPDYLSVYNPEVRFTPAIDRFAGESVVFTRAYTRYGGTGLSMPAMWAGGMLIHKQYVLPFASMNTLEKLLDANGYEMWLSMDHITDQLLGETRPAMELDRNRPEMQYDFCATLAEVQSKLGRHGRPPAPLFVHTRSLNLHVSKLRNRSVPADAAYGGFQGPAAAAVRRMDQCFGGFVEYLKSEGLYDNSIIVLTSDHGDSLGEGKRWGHAMTLFPEVVRVPLIVHVPKARRAEMKVDSDHAAFSTDISPTLYGLLGYRPETRGSLFGRPLITKQDEAGQPPSSDYLLASSYGAVYGLLTENGCNLYIVDAVNRRDFKYDLSNLSPRRVGITAEERDAKRQVIRSQVAELARLYHFSP
jgi:hypothetical protein